MEIMFCTNCGSRSLNFENGIYTCCSCNSKFEKKQIDSKMFVDLRLADEKRQETHFEEAKKLYKKIIEENPDEDLTDVYWGLFLCEQKVIFEEDGKGERFPSFYRISNTSVEDSPEFSKAITYALKHNKEKVEVFNNLGDKIENARKMYLDISQKTKPFDVFICFKNSDGNGNHTPDRQLALDIYNEFNGKYHIFFSEKTLKDIKSSYRDYEPNIYYGLYTSKVMLLICSKKEYIESQWLKNEWSRFTQINKQGQSEKCIIPIFTEGFDPNELPEELWHNQGIFDDRKLISNLDNQLESIIHPVDMLEEFKKEQERAREELRKEQERARLEQEERLRELQNSMGGGNTLYAQINNTIDAIKKFLELGNFIKANEQIENLKKLSPNAFEIYFYSMFIQNRITKIEDLAKIPNILTGENYTNSQMFASTPLQKSLVNELKDSHEKWIEECRSNLKKEFKNKNLDNFKKVWDTLNKLKPNLYELKYYYIFYNAGKLGIEDFVESKENIYTDTMFNIAKNEAKSGDEIGLIEEIEQYEEKYVRDTVDKITKAIENTKDILEIEKVYKDKCEKVKNSRIKQILTIIIDKQARKFYKESLTEINQVVEKEINKVKELLGERDRNFTYSYINIEKASNYYKENVIDYIANYKGIHKFKTILNIPYKVFDKCKNLLTIKDLTYNINELKKLVEYLTLEADFDDINNLETKLLTSISDIETEIHSAMYANKYKEDKDISKSVKTYGIGTLLGLIVVLLGTLIYINSQALTNIPKNTTLANVMMGICGILTSVGTIGGFFVVHFWSLLTPLLTLGVLLPFAYSMFTYPIISLNLVLIVGIILLRRKSVKFPSLSHRYNMAGFHMKKYKKLKSSSIILIIIMVATIAVLLPQILKLDFWHIGKFIICLFDQVL